jgi:hypothetical protein
MTSRRPHVRAARANSVNFNKLLVLTDIQMTEPKTHKQWKATTFRAADGYPGQLRIVGVI